MILAVPILIAVSLFLGWVLIRLAANALPLFVGAAIAFTLLHSGNSVGVALVAGLLASLAVVVFGPIAYCHARSGTLRLMLGLTFGVPAAVAAWYAVQGIAGHVMPAGEGRDAVAYVIAIIVGGVGWRRLAERSASMGWYLSPLIDAPRRTRPQARIPPVPASSARSTASGAIDAGRTVAAIASTAPDT